MPESLTAKSFFSIDTQETKSLIHLFGEWTIANVTKIEDLLHLAKLEEEESKILEIDCANVDHLDTAGIWTIIRLLRELKEHGFSIEVSGLKHHHEVLYKIVEESEPGQETPKQPRFFLTTFLENLGESTAKEGRQLLDIVAFVGAIFETFILSVLQPRRFRMNSIVRHVNETGIDAIPIVALIAFLISVVLAYQGATQLQQFGAEIFTIDLVGISILREMGVLLTAIMVAGRSGSAFAAEIGVMKVNEEVDAIRTMGINPFETLVLPRIIALIITLPLLTFIADITGLLGAALISVLLLDITFTQFLVRLKEAVDITQFFIGIIKAPFFAFVIAAVGSLRGLQVKGSAEQVGTMTTVAVVQSIFLVILLDALFSILFSEMGI